MISRIFCLLFVIFKDIEPIIKLGIRVGLILGLSLAICGNLIVTNMMDSYRRFVQRSLIGISGPLFVETTAEVANALLTGDLQNETVPGYYAWDSQRPFFLKLDQGSEKAEQRVRVVIAEGDYYARMLETLPACGVRQSSANAWGNRLLLNLLHRFDLAEPIRMEAKSLPAGQLRFSDSDRCSIDTGMMTDYPILFLTWQGLGLNPHDWNGEMQIRLLTVGEKETEEWFLKISGYCDRLIKFSDIPVERLICTPKSIFHSKEMEAAAQTDRQAKKISALIRLTSMLLVVVILFFGISMLRALKRDVIDTVRMLGVTGYHIVTAFIFKGVHYGMVAAGFGISLALLTRCLIVQLGWIPFDNYFIRWNAEELAATFLWSAIVVGVSSGCFASLPFLWEKWRSRSVRTLRSSCAESKKGMDRNGKKR